LKITDIELFHISIPLVRAYKLSKQLGTVTEAHAVVAKVFTDKGIIGFGEADPLYPFTKETPESIIVTIRDKIAPQIIGNDPVNISNIELKLEQFVQEEPMACGAINMALFDIAGKYNNTPAHTILGKQKNSRIPLFIAIGSGTPDEDKTNILELIKQNYYGVMIKMGALSIHDEIARMIAAKKRFGNEISILVDANQGWKIDETLEFIEGARDHLPDLIEQPIKRGDLAGLKRIRRQCMGLLCADESIVSIDDANDLIREQAVDVFSLKVSKNGGLTRAKAIAELAHSNGIKCLMNSMLEFGISQAASLQLACTLPNLVDTGHAFGSVLRMRDDITDFAQNISQSVVTIPESPGLGVSLNEKKLNEYTRNSIRIC